MITAIIPARLNSQRIPQKNLKPVGGKPLLFWTLGAALKSESIDKVVLSTESLQIVQEAMVYVSGAFPGSKERFLALQHPNCYSAPEVQTDTIYTYALWESKQRFGEMPEILVLLQPTSPFRTEVHINEAVYLWRKYMMGTVVGVYREKGFHWSLSSKVDPKEIAPVQHNPLLRLGGQWVPKDDWLLRENGAIYVVDAARFGAARNYRLPPYLPYIMSEEDSLDIDTPIDLLVANSLSGTR